jgi:hypothetical protein
MKVDAKLAELVALSHKFAKQSRIGIFCNGRTRSTPFDPKLMFLGAFCYCMKADAKLAELVALTQKFAKQSCVRITA